ncbi:hypothetical protein [Pseudodesulfovibrio portus]|uniref:Uncharacterized protein n=1 Tax=Pseudodesulfovibrio portus TaxID=231439 RepID=A0ABM8ARL2_9BACT|nr:hypothetical protein [Pseudodesulfovibrio portus]BDQ34086.1 hypothetical protein JCM14722_16280 [Pseudodesulfovibrio portus]
MRNIYLIDLMCGISTALDYVSPHVNGHHRRVAMASAAIGNHLGIAQARADSGDSPVSINKLRATPR